MTLEEMRALDARKTYKELEEAKAMVAELRSTNEKLRNYASLLEAWGDELDGLVKDPPPPNCSCHICPPCCDCVDNSHAREVKAKWQEIQKAKP